MSESAFAKRQLEKQGWKEGDGLGKNRDGISKPLKVNLKFDKTGVGHDPGSDFTDHWWLKVFNDAASSIKKPDKDQVTEQKAPPQKIYNGFVKGSILSNGQEEKNSDCCSSDDDADSHQAVSEIPTLDDLYKFCGGATGHRAATLGIRMKGKLNRAAEQERIFNEGKKSKTSSQTSANCGTEAECESLNEPVVTKRKKKKKSKRSKPEDDVILVEGANIEADSEERTTDGDNLKLRISHNLNENGECDDDKVDKVEDSSNGNDVENDCGEERLRKKHKKKKNRKKAEESCFEDSVLQESTEHTTSSIRKSKKAKNEAENHAVEDIITIESEEEEDFKSPKKKKKRRREHKD